AGSEADHLVGIAQVRPALKVLAVEPGHIDQYFLWGRPAGKRRDARDAAGFDGTGHGFTSQIWVAYSAIVRSLENFPEPVTFKIALRSHSSESTYNSRSRWSASR